MTNLEKWVLETPLHKLMDVMAIWECAECPVDNECKDHPEYSCEESFQLWANKEYTEVDTVKHSRWIKISPANIYECGECGQNVMTQYIEAYKFCNGCGTKMDKEAMV